MRKSHLNDEFLLLLGPIISRLFTCSNEEKRVLALVLSLWFSCVDIGEGYAITLSLLPATETLNHGLRDTDRIVSISYCVAQGGQGKSSHMLP
jgi:hypothetical protein